MKKKIILIGSGGHSKVVMETIICSKNFDIVGIVDPQKAKGEKILGISIIGRDSDLQSYFKRGIKNCFITVGSVGNPKARIRLYDLALRIGFSFPNIIHPSAIVSKFVSLGEGNYIAPGVIINADAQIGNNCIINTQAVIEHDCIVGDFVHIAPGAKIGGGVNIGKFSHIGIGSCVLQCLHIGSNTIIGAGSVVLKDVVDNVVAYGNPCKMVRHNNG